MNEVLSMKAKFPVYFLFYFLVFSVFVGAVMAGSKAVTVISESSPVPRKHTLIIDAGHGGIDGGATSCTGVLESNINLQISTRLNDLFHLLGYETRMIRNSDTSVYTQGNTISSQKASDLKERVRIVNSTENAVLISVHQNTFSDQKYSGAQVFYAPTDGSQSFAESLQTAMVSAVNPGSRRKAKKANGVYLMEHIQCPGILVECGFLSNPVEEAMLRTKEYQQKLCCVIAATATGFLTE